MVSSCRYEVGSRGGQMRNETTDAGVEEGFSVHYRKCGCCKHLEGIHLSHGGSGGGFWGIVCQVTAAGHVQSGSASSSRRLMYLISLPTRIKDGKREVGGRREA